MTTDDTNANLGLGGDLDWVDVHDVADPGHAGLSAHTIKEAGAALTTRSGLNFGAGFDLSDDAINDETDVALDLTEVTVPEPTADAHIVDAADAHDASAISVLDTANQITATDVEGALAEVVDAAQAHEAAADPHTGYRLESADHTHASAGAQGGTIDHGALTGTGDDDHTQYRLESESGTFSISAVILNPVTGTTIMVWRAPFACTVTNVRTHFKGGTSLVANARKNQASNHLSSDYTNSTANAWGDGGAVQNTAYSAGDDLELMFVTINGAVTEATIQVDFTRP